MLVAVEPSQVKSTRRDSSQPASLPAAWQSTSSSKKASLTSAAQVEIDLELYVEAIVHFATEPLTLRETRVHAIQ